ncbi:MAG: hypothetical protein O7A09_05575 [Proteobacteria bacterium]|nr:hypothetical protein [Pseudomonadota bacterium]
MAGGTLFDFAAEQLEHRTDLDRLEARGTLRIALKAAGLDSRSVTAEQLQVAVEKILPTELTTRGIGDATAICERLAEAVGLFDAGEDGRSRGSSPEAVFRRLGGD